MVLKLSLMNSYQGTYLEVILKYRNGDISRSSLVFRCSKDNESERRTTALINPRHRNFSVNEVTFIDLKQKCPSRYNGSYPPIHWPSVERDNRKFERIFMKNLYVVDNRIRSQSWRDRISKRVVISSRGDWSNQSVMSVTGQNSVDKSRINNDSKDTYKKL